MCKADSRVNTIVQIQQAQGFWGRGHTYAYLSGL